jgi:tetratricopeptide (TPR) repeat protein
MKKTITILFLFICPVLFAQNPVVDSLALLLKNAPYDTLKLRLLVELSEACDEADILKYATPAVTLANELLTKTPNPNAKYKKGLLSKKAVALNNIGYIYQQQGQVKEALDYYGQSLTIQQEINDKPGMATIFNNIGTIYRSRGQVKEALDYYNRSLKICEEINDKRGVAGLLNNMGSIYKDQEQIKEALDYYNQSLKTYQGINEMLGIAVVLNNIGLIYKSQNQLKDALDYFSKGLKIQQQINDKQGIANALNNIGATYQQKQQLNEALNYYNQSLKIQQEINDKEGISVSFNCLGYIYFKQKNNALALTYATKSLVLAKEIGYVQRICNAENLLSKIDSAKGNGMGALMHYKQYITYRDSIVNTENRKASIQKQLQYEFEKKELATKAAQDKLDTLHAQEKQKQRIIMYAIIGLLLLVIVFAMFMYTRFRITKRQKIIIEKQKQLVDKAYDQLHEKNKEVMDSIRYAKRIQNALITPEKYISNSLNKLMNKK